MQSVTIQKPLIDEKQYDFFTIDTNKLDVLIIRDPHTHSSSAAMSVNAGNFMDPYVRQLFSRRNTLTLAEL